MPIDTAVQRLKQRRTKIVATVGPASKDLATLEALVRAGVDVFRLNFSHGTHDEHAQAYGRIRDVAARTGSHVGVLADLCGPKIRAGTFRGGRITLTTGDRVRVTVREVEGEEGLIPSAYEGLAGDVTAGSRILLDDGNIELVVEGVDGTEVRCTVQAGGVLKDRKGINLPGVAVSAPSLTDKDRDDARFALSLGVDLLALSFVRRAEDVAELHDIVSSSGAGAGIIAKIEKPEALSEIDSILAVSDGIMVARGDLGVELPPEVVPIVQSQLVDLARARGKPVIVATQMLESMISNARPTRAEVTDVSNAVRSGADAVMLSAETAAGEHPVTAVEVMNRVARETEGYLWRRGGFGGLAEGAWRPPGGDGGADGGGGDRGGHAGGAATSRSGPVSTDVRDAVSRATSQLSRDLLVRAIVVFTRTGWSAGMVASSRPQAPVLAVSDDPRTCHRTNLLWGVVPVSHPFGDSPDELHELARRLARESGLASPGDAVLRVWGFHSEAERNVPTVSVLTV